MFGRRRDTEIDGVAYRIGGKFKVVRPGARLSGWKTAGSSSWRGWGRDLEVGEVIVCVGYGPGFGSDPGYGVEFKSEEVGVGDCMFYPMVGDAFSYRPAPGFLEPVEEEVAE